VEQFPIKRYQELVLYLRVKKRFISTPGSPIERSSVNVLEDHLLAPYLWFVGGVTP